MNNMIPRPIISVLSEKLPDLESHASLDSLFMYADAPGEVPEGSKPVKVLEWLNRTNKTSEQPLKVLGKLLEKYMELPELETIPSYDTFKRSQYQESLEFKNSLIKLLGKYGLTYIQGGIISSGGSLPSQSLQNLIHQKNIPAINLEFERALKNVDSQPLEAVSAACNILESVCKVFIEEEKLPVPAKQDLRNLWKTVATALNFDPSQLQDDDLKKIISGMLSVVDGISAFRTHGSSAHGQGKIMYKPKPRHARFAVNSAHSLALFVLETWNENKLN